MNLTDLTRDLADAYKKADDARRMGAEKYTYNFNNLSWDLSEDDPFILIPASQHLKGEYPRITICDNSSPHQRIGVLYCIHPNGDVIVYTQPELLFSGKIILS